MMYFIVLYRTTKAAHDQPNRNEILPMHQQEQNIDMNDFCIEQRWWPTACPEETDE